MAWNTLAAAAVIAEGFNAAEQTTLTAANATVDATAAIVARTVSRVRGVCLAGGNEVESTAATIPDQLAQEAISITVWRLLIKFPALKQLQTAERKAAWEKAEEMLEKVANGDIRVEPPATAASAATAQPGPSFADRDNDLPDIHDRRFTKDTQEG